MKWLKLHRFEFLNPPIMVNLDLVTDYWWDGITTRISFTNDKQLAVLETTEEINQILKPTTISSKIKEGI